MAVYSIEYYGPVGQTDIVAPELAFVNILRVKRNGLAFSVIEDEGNPDISGLRKVNYSWSHGRLHFGDAFIGITVEEWSSPAEKIHVMYKV